MEGSVDLAGADRLLVVCGPTACGKTALALELCRRFDGELVAADSMQVYRGLEIGTAATTQQEAKGVPVHLTGFLPPEQPFSVADWVVAAKTAIAGIHSRGHLSVCCGGTGLYIQSLVSGIDFAEATGDDALRQALYHDWDERGAQAMHNRLQQLDPKRAQKLHLNDQKRILRALEQVLLTGKTADEREANSRPVMRPYNALVLGLTFPEREQLYSAINRRVDNMLAAGLLQEAKLVWQNRLTYKTAAQAIGYKEFFPYFEGQSSVEACADKLKQATRNYAKRQLTWFRQMEDVHWLQAGAPDQIQKAKALIQEWLL